MSRHCRYCYEGESQLSGPRMLTLGLLLGLVFWLALAAVVVAGGRR